MRRNWLGVLAATLACVSTVSCTTDEPVSTATTSTEAPAERSTTTSAVAGDGSVVATHAGERWFLGTVPQQAIAADPSLPPIVIGMINQEDSPVGSYPELRVAIEAAVRWVNAELGGVDGHPVELISCVTPFDATASRQCALDLIAQGVVAFVGGVDVMGAAAMEVIEANDLVVIGGIPATLEEQRSPNAFYFSGGDAGALAAFMAHAADEGATKVAIAYGAEVEAFEVAARDYGAAVGASLGMAVELLPYSIFTTDFSSLMTAALESGASAIAMLAATTSCVPAMTAAASVVPDTQLYLTGACAGDATTSSAGDAASSVLFNAEGPVDGVDVDASIYLDVITKYSTENAGGAGTVAFRGFMNLYSLLLDAGAANANARELSRLASNAVDRPSFWGHPYTCDGDQVPGLPALCAPQQVLFRLAPNGGYEGVTEWIATDDLFATALR